MLETRGMWMRRGAAEWTSPCVVPTHRWTASEHGWRSEGLARVYEVECCVVLPTVIMLRSSRLRYGMLRQGIDE